MARTSSEGSGRDGSQRAARARWLAGTALVVAGAVGLLLACGDPGAPAPVGSAAPGGADRAAESAAPRAIPRAVAVPDDDRDEAAPAADVVVRAPWGEGPGELGRRLPREGAPEGPMSFAVDAAGRAVVLDQVNGRIVTFDRGASTSVQLPADTFHDVELDARGRPVALDRLATGTVAFFDDSGKLDHTVPIEGAGIDEGGAVTGLFARADGTWLEVEHGTLVRIADADGNPDLARPTVPGRFGADGATLLTAALAGPTAAEVTVTPLAGGTPRVTRIELALPVAAIHALESDASGRVVLVVNLALYDERDPDLLVEEHEVAVVLGRDGSLLDRIELEPPGGPEEQLRAFRLGPDGALYQLVCAEAGAVVLRYPL